MPGTADRDFHRQNSRNPALVVGWAINPTSDLHDPLVLHGDNGVFSLASVPNPAIGGDRGFAAITAIPGGGLWYSTLIEFHP